MNFLFLFVVCFPVSVFFPCKAKMGELPYLNSGPCSYFLLLHIFLCVAFFACHFTNVHKCRLPISQVHIAGMACINDVVIILDLLAATEEFIQL